MLRTSWTLQFGCCVLLLAASATRLVAQPSVEQAAEVLLTAANKAYSEKNFAVAVTRYRELLSKFATSKSAPSARHGLALGLLQFPGEKNDTEARDLLEALITTKDAPDYPSIVYHLGLAQRRLGLLELSLAASKPQEAVVRRTKAQQLFAEAAKHFGLALTAYRDLAPPVAADTTVLPHEWEATARARCDQADVLLRLQKPLEAHALTAVFLKDPVLTRSRSRDQGRYLHGFACFLLKDYAAAERILSMLAPFSDAGFGSHARYLLGRTHHLADERAEAALHYEGVLADYGRHKKTAIDALKRPDLLAKDPIEKVRVETLARESPPDHVARASFYWGVLHYEGGRFAEARQRFAEFPKLYPQSPLLTEAQLRLGFCQVQLREFGEAQKTLQPLVDKEMRHADQILFWLAKARAGALPDPKQPMYPQALDTALATFRQAAERARQLVVSDPEAKSRRAEILLELADTQHALKQYQEAAGAYGELLNEKTLPARAEEIHQRLVTALHLAGAYDKSDMACTRFFEQFPKSTLRPAVLFRYAENSYGRYLTAQKNPNLPDRAKELARLSEETAERYQQLIDKCPEFPQVSLARYGLGMAHYRRGELENARQMLDTIPLAERTGELAIVPYLMADCLLRLAPTTVPEDAVAAGKLEEELKSAAQLLDGFAGSQPGSPQTPHALLQLGLCHLRLSSLHADKGEQLKALRNAQVTYEKLLGPQFVKHPLYPQAVLERAKLFGQLGGKLPIALQELRRFALEPLKSAPVAPMALIHLATLLRSDNKATEAADVLSKARQWYEAELEKDPQRSDWVAELRYHHGVALRETGRLAEARVVFGVVAKQQDGPLVFEAALRFGQCLQDEGRQSRERAKKALAVAKKPEEIAAATQLREAGLQTTREALKFLEAQAEQAKKRQPASEVRARMLYEIAWAYRELAESEIDTARSAVHLELIKQLGPHAKKFVPEIPLSKVPVQPSEQKSRAAYLALLDAYPDLLLTTDARVELAELHARRDEHDAAITQLTEALDREPPESLTEKIRVRLGACHAAKGNFKAALAQFSTVAQNAKSPLAGQAHYRIGECHLANQQWAEAVKRLSLFRDTPQFQNQLGLSDRALLRLGFAYAQQNQWEPSRQAYELVSARFGSSPWVHEARFGMGWALEQLKQYEPAVSTYARVTSDTVTETAAKAQLQIGLCRLEQKRYPDAVKALLLVPATYDYRELSAVALLEASRALVELKQTEQAIALLERVVREYPQTAWAKTAQERLQKLRK